MTLSGKEHRLAFITLDLQDRDMTYYDLTIDKYLQIKEALENAEDDLNTQVTLLSIINECTEDELLDLPLGEYHKKVGDLAFLSESPQPRPNCPKTIKIDGEVYETVRDVKKFTAGQYIDYVTLIKNEDFYATIPNILACFFIPKGKDYGKDYDIMEVAKKIRYNVSIGLAMDVCFFFSNEINSFNQLYAGLLGIKHKDKDEESGQGDEGEVEDSGDEDSATEGFFQRWSWFYSIDAVSETLRISWDEVLQKSVVEFLNILSYRKDKNNWQKESFKKANNINGRTY